jgi:hypothetical protein
MSALSPMMHYPERRFADAALSVFSTLFQYLESFSGADHLAANGRDCRPYERSYATNGD